MKPSFSALRRAVPRAGGAALALGLAALATGAQGGTAVALTVVDTATEKPVPCCVYLRDPQGKAVRPAGLPFWRDHFACGGEASLSLPPGEYPVEIERGPEYRPAAGTIRVEGGSPVAARFEIVRTTDMRKRGWRPGELHVHRPLADVPLLLEAADLDVAPVITWWNDRNLWAGRELPKELLARTPGGRRYHVMGGEDEREGGALLYFGLSRPLPIQGATREYPASAHYLKDARRLPGLWVDIEKPFWWDVPVWLSTGMADSIGIANNHMCRSQMLEHEAWGRPRDVARLRPPLGIGFWVQEIYYRLLDAGLRLPPSAGSASGVLPNPVGYNRVYVHTGKDTGYDAWWKGLKAGRSFVTNGPLLEVRANGRLPGASFEGKPGRKLALRLAGTVAGNDRLDVVEVIRNGEVAATIPRAALRPGRELGSFTFETSLEMTGPGWFLVRALADNPRTFRFASTAPFYVTFPGEPERISRGAVRFFAEWLEERIGRIKLDNPAQRAEVMRHFEEARAWWKEREAMATAP